MLEVSHKLPKSRQLKDMSEIHHEIFFENFTHTNKEVDDDKIPT